MLLKTPLKLKPLALKDVFSLVKETRLRRGEKREKVEGNIVRIFRVVFSVEDKNLLSNRFYIILWFSLLAGISFGC